MNGSLEQVAAAKQIQEECLITMLSNNNKGKVQ